MNTSSGLISRVSTPRYKVIQIETSDGKTLQADLSFFENVYCFPKNQQEWTKVAPDSFGMALIWESRFEVHLDQIEAFAVRVEEKVTTV